MDAGVAGLKASWQSIKATAKWSPDAGLVKEWSKHVQEWGPPLEIDEVSVDFEGRALKGRTFLKVGMVVWVPETGPFEVGWQALP
jgi:hypothetical protein